MRQVILRARLMAARAALWCTTTLLRLVVGRASFVRGDHNLIDLLLDARDAACLWCEDAEGKLGIGPEDAQRPTEQSDADA